MLDILYPFSFLASLSGLIGWFYFQDQQGKSRLMSQLFLGGFLVYLVSLGYSSGALSQKFLVLFRDLMVLGVVSQFFGFFRKNKALFVAMLAVMYGLFFIKYLGIMQASFPAQNGLQVETNEQLVTNLAPEGELLVEVNEAHQANELQSIIEKYDLSYENAFQPQNGAYTDLDDYILLNIPESQLSQLKEIKADLMASGLVDYLEENEVIQLDDPTSVATPFRKAPVYGVNDPEVKKQWGFEAMGVDRLHRYLDKNQVEPQAKAAIFILDTGVDAKHEDLAANYKSVKSKYDKDKAMHGTHCAGIAAAVSNNGKGIASFSNNNQFVTVSSIKVLLDFGGGTQSMIIKGIIEAADKGADVISMSLGGPANKSRTRAYEKAVEYANKAGAIVVVAAGNSNLNADSFAPANTPGVITVSAIDTTGRRAKFSNFVSDVDRGIGAPGVGIYSTIPNNKYAAFNGTSMATPYVAGLLGIFKSIRPDLNTEDAYRILHESGKITEDGKMTGRLIQVDKAIEMLMNEI